MSVTNRAFIKAYAWDRTEPSPPTPHLVFAPAKPQMANSDQATSSAAMAPGASTGQPPQPTSSAKLGIPRQQSNIVPPKGSKRSASVTNFVPAPHIPLKTVHSGHASQRTPLSTGRKPADPAETSSAASQASEPEKKTSQPLSSFTTDAPVQENFEPAFGVPEFAWPEPCSWIDEHFQPDYTELFSMLEQQDSETAPVIAITGAWRGEGRSTALLSIAQESARQGIKTAIVDGDFAQPSLAEQLSVVASKGWEEVLTGQLTLSEAMIFAEREKIALLPLGNRMRDMYAIASSLHVAISLAVLSQHYDLVLVDAGPLCAEPTAATTLLRRAHFTGALLVQDTRQASAEEILVSALERLSELKIPALGVIENFGDLTNFAPPTDPQRTNAA